MLGTHSDSRALVRAASSNFCRKIRRDLNSLRRETIVKKATRG
jgi:hypothetical protein